MNESPSATEFPTSTRSSDRRHAAGRLARLARKELREILRDRRTIVTLVVMPLLVYPLLALVFQRFLLTSLQGDGTVEYVIGAESEHAAGILAQELELGRTLIDRKSDADADSSDENGVSDPPSNGSHHGALAADEDADRPVIHWVLLPKGTATRHVADASVHLAVVLQPPDVTGSERGLQSPVTWELYFRAGSPSSEAALRLVESRLRAFNTSHLDQQLKRLGVLAAVPAESARHAVEFAGAPAFSLAALIPLILILTTVTGAVYPAIDLTAGERERGTLETLIAAPVPRLGLLVAKYVAVLTVALLTAVVNLAAMTITAHSTGLNESLFGGTGMSVVVVLKVLALLALFAAFFSAILLAITSYARSFKEAQAYIIPLMLLCLVPGIVCLTPSLEFTGTLAVVPLVNIVVLARDVLEGSVDPALATAAVLSTALYVAAALALAAHIFGTDAILYGSQSSWSDLLRRTTLPQTAASVPAAMFCVALMFPCYFLFSANLARARGTSMEQRLVLSALITAVVFGGIPWIVARFNRVCLGNDMTFRRPGIVGWLAAGLLGLVLWPAAHEVFLLNQALGLTTLEGERVAAVKNLLDQWRAVPLWLILLSLAVVPGVFEEFFFRGMFFTSLRRVLSPARTIIATAVVFGLFHVLTANVLAPERFLPSAFLGLVLGWVRLRTGSVLPCMLLHALHNGLLLTIVYWRNELAAGGFGVQETVHLPFSWLAASIVGVLIAAAMIAAIPGARISERSARRPA